MNKKPSESSTPVVPAKKKEARKPRDRVKLLTYGAAFCAAIAVGAVIYAGVTASTAASEISHVKAETSPAVVAKVAISAGTVIESDAVVAIDVPSTYLAEGATANISEVIGKTATANIAANAQVSVANLAGAGNATALAQALAPDMMATSIAVNSESGVAGLIRQGDYVDVLAEGGVIIEHARVLALDTQLTGDITQYSTVTVEITANEAGVMQMAQMDNPVRLVLNPYTSDAVVE